MKSEELLAALEEIRNEQARMRRSIETIQGDLSEFEKDHLIVDKLKTEVAGLRTDTDNLIEQNNKHQRTIENRVEQAVERGLEPVVEVVQDLGDGIKKGKIPIDNNTAQGIKNQSFLSRLFRKWRKYDTFGREKKGV